MFQNPELLIDKEIEDLLFTDTDCSPLAVPFIHRKIRKNESGSKVVCTSCRDKLSGNAQSKIDCPYCDGIGYLWDEDIKEGWFYKEKYMTSVEGRGHDVAVGQIDATRSNLLVKKDIIISEGDFIYQIKMNSSKRIDVPLQIINTYKVHHFDVYSSNQTFSEFNIARINKWL